MKMYGIWVKEHYESLPGLKTELMILVVGATKAY
jgi:hypothetical protein